MYTEKELAQIARRENNNKRGYLVVNPLQGKHVPAIPSKALALFEALARTVKDQRGSLSSERLLVIGFAETATAIGSSVAVALDCPYIQTTREIIENVDYFFFSEVHSHASQQKLVKEDMDHILSQTDRIIFAEDEITTGNTILNLIDILDKDYGGRLTFSAASILNGMNEECRAGYLKRGIALHYLVETDHSRYTDIAMGYKGDGIYHLPAEGNAGNRCNVMQTEGNAQVKYQVLLADGYCNGRRLVQGGDYEKACARLWEQIQGHFKIERDTRILVLGTEEFMYPALYAAGRMEETGAEVRFHATTRSPIEVSSEPEYPLHERYELRSLYEGSRVTFLYELKAYDEVYVITDAPEKETEGWDSLTSALIAAGNQKINVIRWCNS